MTCPICGAELRHISICMTCGWDVSEDFSRFPTLFSVDIAGDPLAFAVKQATSERRLTCARLGDLLFAGRSTSALQSFLSAGTPAEAARRLLRSHEPKAPSRPESAVCGPNFLRSDERGETVLGSDVLRSDIEHIRFSGTVERLPSHAWDASEEKNGSVFAFVRRTDGLMTLTVCGKGGVRAGPSCRGLFARYKNLRSVDFGGAFLTDGCRDMSSMFEGCSSLQSLELSGLRTYWVTNLSSMLSDCSSLVSVGLRGLYTGRVTDASFMFSNCTGLTSLDVGSFDTSRMENMGSMFSGCKSLRQLNVSGFDTSKARNLSFMFFGCVALQRLDLRNFVIQPGCSTTGMLNGVGSVIRQRR